MASSSAWKEVTRFANTEKSMCLAGVFGGEESGVTENTVDVFLESAYFNPVSIRKSSKRHTLKTDASFRYERGADPLVVEYAAKRAALLIQELAGGKIVGKVQEFYPEKIEKKVATALPQQHATSGQRI